MKAGRMRYRLTLLRPERTADRMGAERTTYVETTEVWAERVSFSGSMTEEASAMFSNYAAQWRIRDAAEVSEGWRVRQRGGHLYTVCAIEPNIFKGFNVLRCERVND